MSDALRSTAHKELAKKLNLTPADSKPIMRPGGFVYTFKEAGAPVIATDTITNTEHGTRDSYVTISKNINGQTYAMRYAVDPNTKALGSPEVLKLGADGKPIAGFKLADLDAQSRNEINRGLGAVSPTSPEMIELVKQSFNTGEAGLTRAASLDEKVRPAAPGMMA